MWMNDGSGRWITLAALVVSTTSGAARPTRVTVDGREILTNAVVVSTPGGPLVPLRSVSQALGGQLQWDAAAKTAAVQYRGRRLDVDERRHRLLLDGQSLAGTAGPQSAHGQLLVPLAAVERLFGVRGEWQPDRGLLKL